MYPKVIAFLKNPIISLIVAIVLGYIYHLLALEKYELSYSVSNEEIIATTQPGSPELTINWNETPVKDEIKRFKVAIWNSGEKYIDHSQFSKTTPLQMELLSPNNKIFAKNISSTSRASLKIELDNKSEAGISIIKIAGDDGLEPGDGFVISVFYTGKKKPEIELSGRIKEVKNSFTKVQWNEIQDNWGKNKTVVLLLGIILFATCLVLFYFLADAAPKNRAEKLLKNAFHLLAFLILLLYLVITIGLISSFFSQGINGIDWIV